VSLRDQYIRLISGISLVSLNNFYNVLISVSLVEWIEKKGNQCMDFNLIFT